MKTASAAVAWPVDLIPAEEGGFIVNFLDLPNGWGHGETRDEALAQADDLLDEMILGRMAHNEDVPRPLPAKERPVVALPALTEAKLEAYRAMRAAGLNKSQLAERLGWQPSQVTRLFDGRHASRLDQIEAALHALGYLFRGRSGDMPRQDRRPAPAFRQAFEKRRFGIGVGSHGQYAMRIWRYTDHALRALGLIGPRHFSRGTWLKMNSAFTTGYRHPRGSWGPG